MTKEIHFDKNSVFLYLNEELYTKEVLFHTAYVLLEDYYFFFDKKDSYFEVQISLKNSSENIEDLKRAVDIFKDELVESAAYLKQLEKTSGVRELLLERALLTQTSEESDFDSLAEKLDLKED